MSNNNWQTPLSLFRELNQEFRFDLDPCTTLDNPLGTRFFFTSKEDGLKQNWSTYRSIFINPPYGYEIKPNGKRGEYLLEKWINKAYNEFWDLPNYIKYIVMLLPSLSSPDWFHSYVWDNKKHRPKNGVQIRYLDSRVKFLDEGKKKQSPRFDSMIVIFSKNEIL